MPTTPHPITKEKIPLTLGHEFSGVIEEVGDDITDIKIGQRVSVQPIIYDGTCSACRDGLINCCDNNGFVGLSGVCRLFRLRSNADESLWQVGAAGFRSTSLYHEQLSMRYLIPYRWKLEVGCRLWRLARYD